MKKLLTLFTALTVIISTGCKKSDVSSNSIIATKFAKINASVYKNKTLDSKSWETNLEKGEPVSLLEEETIKSEKNQQIKVSKVKLSDDKIVYIKSDNLAVKPVVFIDKDVRVYVRNNINSGEFAIIPAGTLGFVVDEKADWIQVDIGEISGKKVFGKWVKGGVSDNAELIADAVSLEKARAVLSESIKGKKEDAITLLRSISAKDNPMGRLAKDDLEKIEGPQRQPEPAPVNK